MESWQFNMQGKGCQIQQLHYGDISASRAVFLSSRAIDSQLFI